MDTKQSFRKSPIAHIFAIVIGVLWLVPVYWMLNSSFQEESELLSWPPHLLPSHFTTSNFVAAWNHDFLGALKASLTVAALTIIVGATAALLAAMALSRFRFRGRTSMIVAILVVQMIPAEALFISLSLIHI